MIGHRVISALARGCVHPVLNCAIAALVAAGLVLTSGSAEAATFTVDTPLDNQDVAPGDGVCAAPSGGCTLRAAVMETNATPDADTIIVPAGTYLLSVPGAREDFGRSGDLDIRGTLSILGAGADVTTIDGNGLDRVIHVHQPIASVLLAGLRITGGDSGGEMGGGIWFEAVESFLVGVRVEGNASTSLGGGILAAGGSLRIEGGSVIAGNQGGAGGGLLAGSSVTIRDSTFADNVAGSGGGISTFGGSLDIARSLFTGNQGSFGGGAIETSSGAVIVNSTFSGNVASSGSSILNRGPVTVGNSTFADGTVDMVSPQSGGMAIGNSILAGSCRSSFFAPIVSHGGNIGTDATCRLIAPGDQPNTDPLLDVLADNGGLTLTHALLPGSPALDAADNSACPATDQRGVPRDDGACDAGAFEFAVLNVAPVAQDDFGSTKVDEFVIVDVLANDFDDDGDTLTVLSVGDGAHGTVEINGDGTVTYTRNPGFNGADAFTYDVTDGNGGTAQAIVTVQITPDLVLGAGVTIGPGTSIAPGATIGDGVTIGANSVIAAGVVLGDGVTVGDNSVIGENSTIQQGSTLGDGATLGSDVTIGKSVSGGANFSAGDSTTVQKDVVIGDGVTLGARVTLGKDSTIGDNSSIGERSVISKNTVIGSNVLLGDRSRVKKGSVIPDGTTLP